jgi:hypothetical protein
MNVGIRHSQPQHRVIGTQSANEGTFNRNLPPPPQLRQDHNRSQAIISAGAGAVAAVDILAREEGKDVQDWDTPPK